VVALAPATAGPRRWIGAMSGTREAVLARVRAPSARRRRSPRSRVRTAKRGALGAGGDSVTVDRFCERVADSRENVKRVSDEELPRALMAAYEHREARPIAVPAEAPLWTVEGVELVRDDPLLSPRQLDALDGVL
jgi:hypothetical protein